MNINLVYEGKDYNFDIPNGVTIDYLKELSSKIFNSDKALLDLVYKNEKFKINDDNALIRDLIPEGETNAILTVQINKNLNNLKKNEVVPLATLKTKRVENNDKEKKKNNTNISMEKSRNLKIKEIQVIKEKSEDKKENQNRSLNFYKDNKNNIKNKIIINNKNINLIKKEFDIKLFENIYIKKSKELLSLIKEFNNKVKEVYMILYKKYKNSGGITINNISSSSNSSISSINNGINSNYFYELTIYEKKLIDFQEKQIKNYKKLLESIKKFNKDGEFLKLNEFFSNLIIFGINNIKENITEPIKLLKLKKITNSKILQGNNVNNTIFGNNSSKNLNNNFPHLNLKNTNSSLIFEKKNNNSIILNNNISGIRSVKSKSKTNSLEYNHLLNNLKSKNLNNMNTGVKTSKIRRSSLIVESKLSMKNENNDNNNDKTNNEFKNENSKNKENNNKENNSSLDLSEKDSVDSITNNNKYNFKEQFSPLRIRKATTSNFINKARKISVISNSLISSNNGKENIERVGSLDKSNLRYNRLISANNLKNKIKSPVKRRITIEENSPSKNNKKWMNDSVNENGFNKKKIIDIDVSSMTVNDSNFVRDKQSYQYKKNKKTMNKYDFFM